jgi:chromosome segregation ATPase
LSKAQIAEKTVEAVEHPNVTGLVQTNAQLWAELAAAHAKVVEVENRKRVLISNYNSLHSDYGNLESMFTTLQKEKADLEKTERKKAQRFCQQLCSKLHGLRREFKNSVGELDGQCLEFPNTGWTVGGILDWFNEEVQALPNTFTEANQNITYYAEDVILKMLEGVGCVHLTEL